MEREYITADTQHLADLPEMDAWARGIIAARDPDFIIGPSPDGVQPNYIRRWWIVPRNPWSNLYLHLTQRSDEDRALHDHPWDNSSFIIAGGYTEITPRFPNVYDGPNHGRSSDLDEWIRKPGDVIQRPAATSHRLVIADGAYCISLFATGPKIREWGFWCPQGWRHWRDFTTGQHGQSVGLGCD